MKIWSGKHRILMSLTFPVLLLHISSFHWISNFILPDNIFSNKNIWHLNENADIKNQESNERICPFSKIALSNADESRVPLSIPVVIYIIYDPSLQGDQSPYPTDAQILAGIDWINNLLAGGPACPGDLVSVETGIRLCLATRDIGGQPTSGHFTIS